MTAVPPAAASPDKLKLAQAAKTLLVALTIYTR